MEYNIENGEGNNFIQRKRNYYSKLKKGNFKIKKLIKITILDEQEPSVQSADRTKAVQVWSWGNMYLLKKPGQWPSQHLHLKINSGFHASKNPKQQNLKVVTFSDASFSKKRFHSAKSAFIQQKGRVASWLVTCTRKPKVPGSDLVATYVQRWALCINRLANV